MKQFAYTISDPLGIHARPAGLLAKTAKGFEDTVVMICRGGECVRVNQLMKLMGMGVRQGDQVTVTAEGASEEAALAAIKRVFEENL